MQSDDYESNCSDREGSASKRKKPDGRISPVSADYVITFSKDRSLPKCYKAHLRNMKSNNSVVVSHDSGYSLIDGNPDAKHRSHKKNAMSWFSSDESLGIRSDFHELLNAVSQREPVSFQRESLTLRAWKHEETQQRGQYENNDPSYVTQKHIHVLNSD